MPQPVRIAAVSQPKQSSATPSTAGKQRMALPVRCHQRLRRSAAQAAEHLSRLLANGRDDWRIAQSVHAAL